MTRGTKEDAHSCNYKHETLTWHNNRRLDVADSAECVSESKILRKHQSRISSILDCKIHGWL